MMKTPTIMALNVFLLFSGSVWAADHDNKGGNVSINTDTQRIRIVFDQHEVEVRLFDNPASRDFLSLLPLTLEFEDFASEEKIAYLPRKLNTKDAPSPRHAQGDFTYYAPWGNLAVFYRGFGSDEGLIVLGRIESGKEKLADMHKNFKATIRKFELRDPKSAKKCGKRCS